MIIISGRFKSEVSGVRCQCSEDREQRTEDRGGIRNAEKEMVECLIFYFSHSAFRILTSVLLGA